MTNVATLGMYIRSTSEHAFATIIVLLVGMISFISNT